MSQQHDYVIGKNAVIETLKSDRKLYKLWMAENTVKGGIIDDRLEQEVSRYAAQARPGHD